jgi:hypothetical protein
VRFPGATHRNIYVRSERAGQRVMESITQFITQELKLKVNEAKSAVARPQERKFLGFSFTAGPEVKRVIATKALDRFKQRIREITIRAKGVSMKATMEELAPYMRGWRSYFGFCETPEVLIGLTRWVRLRLRAAMWRQWKTQRRRRAALLELGVRPRLAMEPLLADGLQGRRIEDRYREALVAGRRHSMADPCRDGALGQISLLIFPFCSPTIGRGGITWR